MPVLIANNKEAADFSAEKGGVQSLGEVLTRPPTHYFRLYGLILLVGEEVYTH